jgi:hypothetical protein
MGLLHLFSRIAPFESKMQPDKPESHGYIPCRSAGMLGRVRIHRVLVNELPVLFCDGITEQITTGLQARR